MQVTGEQQSQAWLDRRLPPLEEVRDGSASLPVPIPRSPLRYTLTYVLEIPDGVLVLDPGWDVDEAWTALSDGLAGIGGRVSDVRGVVVTHVHPRPRRPLRTIEGGVRSVGGDAPHGGVHPAGAPVVGRRPRPGG